MGILRQIEHHVLEWALYEAGGSVSAVADRLGLPLRTAYHRIRQCGIQLPYSCGSSPPEAGARTIAEICGALSPE